MTGSFVLLPVRLDAQELRPAKMGEKPIVWYVKADPTRWVLNGAAIYRPGRLEDRLALLDHALGLVAMDNDFIQAEASGRRPGPTARDCKGGTR